MILDLLRRFIVISLLAFGGGQSALPLVAHMAVTETGWISPQDFSTALAFSYVTPGPVLILATFIGYRVAGLAGGLAATVGAFLCPWLLATLAAQQIQRFMNHPWLRGFGRGAGPAVVGLLGVTAWSIAQQAFTSWPYALIAAAALALGLWRKVHLIFVLLGGAVLGIAISVVTLPVLR